MATDVDASANSAIDTLTGTANSQGDGDAAGGTELQKHDCTGEEPWNGRCSSDLVESAPSQRSSKTSGTGWPETIKFARTDLARLTKMLIDQVCEATGGPCRYNGRSMKEAHAGMKVTKGEFSALVEDLVATLNQFKVPSAEQDELLAILGPLKSDIVEVDSSEVGTPLPDEFRPAPALMA